MKKKIVIFTIIFIMILNLFSICHIVNAEAEKIEVNLTGSPTIKQDTKTIELTLSLGSFNGVQENIVLGYETTVEYDKDMFTNVEVQGLNGWNATYESQTNKLVGELSTATARANMNITKITLTLKDGIEPETSGTFKLNNLQLTDDDQVDITVNKSITFTMEKAEEPQQDSEYENLPTPTQEKETTKVSGEQTAKTSTQKTSENTQKVSALPHAGIQNYIVITLLIVFIVGVLALIRYKTIKIK